VCLCAVVNASSQDADKSFDLRQWVVDAEVDDANIDGMVGKLSEAKFNKLSALRHVTGDILEGMGIVQPASGQLLEATGRLQEDYRIAEKVRVAKIEVAVMADIRASSATGVPSRCCCPVVVVIGCQQSYGAPFVVWTCVAYQSIFVITDTALVTAGMFGGAGGLSVPRGTGIPGTDGLVNLLSSMTVTGNV
jgi:hypothetical protein